MGDTLAPYLQSTRSKFCCAAGLKWWVLAAAAEYATSATQGAWPAGCRSTQPEEEADRGEGVVGGQVAVKLEAHESDATTEATSYRMRARAAAQGCKGVIAGMTLSLEP